MNMNRKTILILVLLALALTGGGLLTKRFLSRQKADSHAEHKKTIYQCPMHPQIVSDEPGDCPICNMALQPVVEEAPETAPAPEGQRKILHYRHPMRPDVTSPVPAKDEMGMDYIPVYEDEKPQGESAVPGHAGFTLSQERQQLIGVKTRPVQRRNLEVTVRAAGKVAYDPDLYTALAEHREALAARAKAQDSPMPEAGERAESLVQSTALRLKLLGFSQEQLAEIHAQSPDATDLLLPDKTNWVYAQVYEYEMGLVQPGQRVMVTVPSLPGKTFQGTITAIDPVLNAATRTARVRARVSFPEGGLRPETFVHVQIHVPMGRPLAVPEEAILDTGEHKIAFVKKGQGTFEPRSVKLGREADGHYEVLSGLAEGEEVVTSANFFIDSESRFRAPLANQSQRHAH